MCIHVRLSWVATLWSHVIWGRVVKSMPKRVGLVFASSFQFWLQHWRVSIRQLLELGQQGNMGTHHLYDLCCGGTYAEPAYFPQAAGVSHLHHPSLPEHCHDVFRSKLLPHGYALICIKNEIGFNGKWSLFHCPTKIVSWAHEATFVFYCFSTIFYSTKTERQRL